MSLRKKRKRRRALHARKHRESLQRSRREEPVTIRPVKRGIVVAEDRAWFALRLRPRWSGRVGTDFERDKRTFLQPRQSEIVIRKGKRAVRRIPVISRTIFVGVPAEIVDKARRPTVRGEIELAECIAHPGVDGVLRIDEKPVAFKPEALQQFVDAIAGVEEDAQAGIVPGQAVRVLAGPFMTFGAVVQKLLPKDRVRVDVMIFGRATEIDLGLAEVEAW